MKLSSNFKALLALFTAAIVTGCTHSPTSLASTSDAYRYTVEVPYETVYQRIFKGARDCYENHNLPLTAYGDIQELDHTARVYVAASGNTVSVFEILAVTDTSTQVRGAWSMNISSDWKQRVIASRYWADGHFTTCEENL